MKYDVKYVSIFTHFQRTFSRACIIDYEKHLSKLPIWYQVYPLLDVSDIWF